MKTTSLNELVYELLELRRSYIKNTDPVPIRLVVDWVQSQRARLIQQKLQNPLYTIDDHYVQELGSISMEKVLSNVAGISNYDYMWRTSVEIPRTIETRDGKGAFVRIGPSDRLTDRYLIETHDKAIALGYGKFNYNAIYAFTLGNYIYTTSNSGIHFTNKYIDIRGVFQDPITVARIIDPDWSYNDDYPINKELIDQMKELIVQSKFPLTLIQADDKVDNKEDDPTSVQAGKA
jgi:hypothetical protein